MSQKRTRLHQAVLAQMLTLVTSGFGLVAALAWNEVIKTVVESYIKPYFGKGSGLVSLVVYAAVVTTVAVIIATQITDVSQNTKGKRG